MRAVVPAYNEQVTIQGVVKPLLDARLFDEVVVVDDGSTDRTAEIATDAGARVLQPPHNLGKGGAMLFGVENACAEDEVIAFFDADLYGLRPEHAHRLANGIAQGYDMVCGLRDKGPVQNVLQLGCSPVITGERMVRRWVLDALPQTCWDGYCIETALNDMVHRHGGRTALVFLRGVTMRTKSQKTGFGQGLRDYAKMTGQILRTRRALRESGGTSCRR
jgi:glycosyltransferase involved in cell wall biosynthesis